MKYLYLLVISLVLVSSCNKDKITKNSQILELNPLKKAYYNSENKRYLEKSFTSDSLSYQYRVIFEKNKSYRFLIYGMNMQKVNLTLLDLDDKKLADGQQANVEFTARYLEYKSSVDDTLIIKISTEDVNLAGETFYLAFEEINSYEITWLGKTWICDGDWTADAKDKLIFKGYNSGFSKWIKLKDNDLKNYTAVVVFETKELPAFVGIACNATDTIWQMLNLPEKANQFKVKSVNSWEFLWINNGVGRETGTFTEPDNGIFSIGIVKSDSITCFVNDEKTYTAGYNSTSDNGFYITIEDKDVDEFIFDDFVIE